MHIGLTYDLCDEYLAEGYHEEETAEFDRRDTIDAIEQALRTRGFGTARIGRARSLMRRLALGERWDLVFNIAEGMYGFGREALIPALLEAHHIPCVFSDSFGRVASRTFSLTDSGDQSGDGLSALDRDDCVLGVAACAGHDV
jgi:D-alanine-D-alanine ligase